MPRQRAPLFSLRATGLLGGHRRGALDPLRLTRIVFPIRDSTLIGLPVPSQDDNFGGSAVIGELAIIIAGDKVTLQRSIAMWDLRSFIGQTFSAATLDTYVSTLFDFDATQIISRCTINEAWLEPEVTWNSIRTGTPWDNGGGDFDDIGPPAAITRPNPGAAGYYTLEGLAPFVNDALVNRFGFLSIIGRLTDEDPQFSAGLESVSKEGLEERRPFLTLTP